MISSRARATTCDPLSVSGSSSRRIAGGSRGRLLSTCRSRVFIAAVIVSRRSRSRRIAAVPRVTFTANLRRLVDCPAAEVAGATVGEALEAPQWHAKPADIDERSPARGAPVPWSLDQMWVFEADPREPQALWCGTMPCGLFRSTNGGDSWRLLRPLWDKPERRQWFGGGYDFPGIHSICVDPRDPRRVLVGVSCGGAWQ